MAGRDKLVTLIRLSDGGLYDNMGLKSVWKDHEVLLLSDGGAVFETDRDSGLFQRIKRYQAIAGRQDSVVRKRWLIFNFLAGLMRGAYWGIDSAAAHYKAEGYSKQLVDEVISEMRTDVCLTW